MSDRSERDEKPEAARQRNRLHVRSKNIRKGRR